MEFHLMGDLAVVKDGATLSLPGSRKTRALLAYLILKPGPVSRERLCELFWQIPDDPRGSLRWSLSKLRGLVDEADAKRIVADREHVAFEGRGATIDVLDFRQAIADGLADLATTDLEQLATAASRGFLRGLDLNGQVEFDHFLATERESFRIGRVSILLELASRPTDNPADTARWLQELVDAEPYSVDAHVKLLTTLATAGRKEDAQRQLTSSLATLGVIEEGDRALLQRAAATPPVTGRSTNRSSTAASESGQSGSGARPPPDDLHQDVGYCRAADGTRIAFAEVGAGPPLIKTANWLNHLEFDWESPVWRHVFRALADGRKLIRYDARGNGLSDWNVQDFQLEKQVTDLEAVVEATGLDRFPLLGLSQGCAVSVEFAARYPEKVSRLILIGGYARGWNRIGSPDLIKQSEAMITLVGTGWGQDNPAFRQMFTSLFMPDAPAENQSWFNELQRLTTTPENAASLIRANGDVDVLERLSLVKAPTLVLHATNDMRIPINSGRELASAIPNARFVELDSRNHLMPESDSAWPIQLAEINAFLAQ
jgi:DNA-binding SARP family transcriptional activator/pimeloyl-ACP methyl ester carboxylesterase